MIIVLRKRHLLLSGLLCCFLAGLAAVLFRGSAVVPAFSAGEGTAFTAVIDPGHGGEDGGAVSPDGVEEGRLNLEISLRLEDLLRFAGQRVVMTRREDVSICDEGLSTVRQRKSSDLKNRAAIVNETENAVLLSIHQNSLPSSPVTHGAQVFWNGGEGAEPLAESIQEALNGAVNTGNEKHCRRIPDSIYLMKQTAAPGVLVECGFLSNAGETGRLQEPEWQLRLAAAIAAGYLRFASGEV